MGFSLSLQKHACHVRHRGNVYYFRLNISPPTLGTLSILTGLGLIVDGKLTNAAVVLYGKAEKLESIYLQCSIRVARFRGTDRLADFSDNRHYW
ncbi:MAG: hypothetical protein KFF46_01610, partial [Desulfobacterales bacterium]|nr:hypothetical protein [Desulfobacterales bacterium]